MIRLRIYFRSNRKNSAGECPIYFIVRDNWTYSGVNVMPQYWDAKNGVIIKKHPKYYVVKPPFFLLKSRAEQVIPNYQTSGVPFNKDYFEKCIFTGQDNADNPW